MKIEDNATLTTFLLGHPIQIIVSDDNGMPIYDITMQSPTIYQLFTDKKIQTIIGIFNTPIDQLQKKFTTIQNFTHYSFFTTAGAFTAMGLNVYAQYLEYTFKELGVNLQCKDTILINGHLIDEEVFNYLRYTLLYAAQIKDKGASELEKDERYISAQERINRIKSQKKNQTNNDKAFESNYITLLYEFGLSPTEIKLLNPYQYAHILKYTSGSIQYKVSLIAAGNGNTKRVKFITKGDK